MSGNHQQPAANSQNVGTSSTPWYYTKLDTKALERDLDFEEMFKRMRCEGGCSKSKKKLPNPRHRFLCPKEHDMLCWKCGMDRLEKYEATCLSEIVDSLESPTQDQEECEKCQEKIQYPADPIYFAFYKNAMMWKYNQGGSAPAAGNVR